MQNINCLKTGKSGKIETKPRKQKNNGKCGKREKWKQQPGEFAKKIPWNRKNIFLPNKISPFSRLSRMVLFGKFREIEEKKNAISYLTISLIVRNWIFLRKKIHEKICNFFSIFFPKIVEFSRFFETMNSRRYNLQSHYVFKGKTVFKCSFQKLGALQSGTPKNQSADCPKGSTIVLYMQLILLFSPFQSHCNTFWMSFSSYNIEYCFWFFLSIHAIKEVW